MACSPIARTLLGQMRNQNSFVGPSSEGFDGHTPLHKGTSVAAPSGGLFLMHQRVFLSNGCDQEGSCGTTLNIGVKNGPLPPMG